MKHLTKTRPKIATHEYPKGRSKFTWDNGGQVFDTRRIKTKAKEERNKT